MLNEAGCKGGMNPTGLMSGPKSDPLTAEAGCPTAKGNESKGEVRDGVAVIAGRVGKRSDGIEDHDIVGCGCEIDSCWKYTHFEGVRNIRPTSI